MKVIKDLVYELKVLTNAVTVFSLAEETKMSARNSYGIEEHKMKAAAETMLNHSKEIVRCASVIAAMFDVVDIHTYHEVVEFDMRKTIAEAEAKNKAKDVCENAPEEVSKFVGGTYRQKLKNEYVDIDRIICIEKVEEIKKGAFCFMCSLISGSAPIGKMSDELIDILYEDFIRLFKAGKIRAHKILILIRRGHTRHKHLYYGNKKGFNVDV